MNRQALDRMTEHWKSAGLKISGTAGQARFNADAKDVTVDESGKNRDITVVANTAAVDLDDEVVVPEGADLSYIKRNRKIFIDHWYDYDHMIGGIRLRYPRLENGKWVVRFGVTRSDLGDRLLRDAEDFGIGVSIGFDALDRGPPTEEEVTKYGGGRPFSSILRRWRWVELSVTAMPCNVDAQSFDPAPPVKRAKWTITPHGVFASAAAAR